MLHSKELQNRIAQFTQYARFLSKRFGVRVELDGTKAQTDGKVITLPNVATLTPRENEFMYGILLHEISHIKYSTFTEEDFGKLPNEMVAQMANSIEDARIENLLMDDYDGAHDILKGLYCDYINDKKLMKKLFNVDLKKSSGFFALGVWMHAHILNIDNLPNLSKMVGSSTAKQVNDFVKMQSVDLLMDNIVLENWNDVVELAKYMTELWFKGNIKKQGKLNNISEQRDLVTELQKILGSDLQEKNKIFQGEVQSFENEIFAKEAEIEKISKTPEYNDLSKELSAALDKFNQIKEEKRVADSAASAETRANKAKAALSEAYDKIVQNKERLIKIESNLIKPAKNTQDLIDQLVKKENKISGATDEKGKKQLKNIQKKLAEARNQIQKNGNQLLKTDMEKCKDKIKQLENEKLELDKKAIDLRNAAHVETAEAKKTASEMMKISSPDRQQLLDDAKKMLDSTQNKINEFNKIIETLRSEINALIDKINSKEKKMGEYAKKILADAQNDLNKSEIAVNLLPEFIPSPGWENGDKIQKEFDKNARDQTGDWVVNGTGLGTGGRSIILYIEKRAKALNNVDLAKIFKQKNNISKLDSMNETTIDSTYITNHSPAKNTNDSNKRKHMALTTEFDRIKMKLQGDKAKITKLQQEYGYFINPFVQIIKQKLKFARKNYFRGNQEEGDLDVRSLWKLASRESEDFFEVNNPKFVNKISAMIAVDISGSQDKEFTKHGENLQVLTLALSEAMKTCHIRHEIMGYHAPVEQVMRDEIANSNYNRRSNRLETEIYKTFASSNNNGIANIDLRASDNSDGESIRIAIARLKKTTTTRKILFVLTDGKPFLSDADLSVLDDDLREALADAKKNRIEVIAFGFNEQSDIFYDQYCYINTWDNALQWAKDKMK